MRTMILAVIALSMLTAPVWATVTISAVQRPGELIVDINYDFTGELEKVRAFALDVSVDAGVITEVNDFEVGDDNFGYGIFPANFSLFINVDPDGTVPANEWDDASYTPVAPGTDPDALGGIDTNGVTLEMGALYVNNPPNPQGRLCSLTVSEECTLSLALNGMRGNVVLENAAEPSQVDLVGTEITLIWPECFPNIGTYAVQYAEWVKFGKPDCWCGKGTGVTSIPEYDLGYQCDGDAATDDQVIQWRVYTNDLALIAAHWKKKGNDVTLDPCADIDHEGQVIDWRVYTNDLSRLAANWKFKTPVMAGDCPRPD